MCEKYRDSWRTPERFHELTYFIVHFHLRFLETLFLIPFQIHMRSLVIISTMTWSGRTITTNPPGRPGVVTHIMRRVAAILTGAATAPPFPALEMLPPPSEEPSKCREGWVARRQPHHRKNIALPWLGKANWAAGAWANGEDGPGDSSSSPALATYDLTHEASEKTWLTANMSTPLT